jgi:outer membrane protein assembly factor BamE (lipoprotein component of BamABCDE complex)
MTRTALTHLPARRLFLVHPSLVHPFLAHLPLVILLLASLVLASCAPRLASHGHPLEDFVLESLIPGESRKADILNRIGQPSFEGAFGSGKLYYVSQTMITPVGGRKETQKRALYILSFDQNNILQSIDMIDEAEGINVVTNKEATPTPGDTFGAVEQIFSNLRRRQAEE